MLLSEQPDKIPLAFAENGEKDVIPEGSSPFDGRASLNDGFPPETRQALIDGGIPPSGLDMNGILWLATAINRWQSAGGFFVYDNDFATDTNVDGYPKGAMLVRADGTGFWVSTADNNTTDPDAGGAGWQPVNNIGIHSVSMTGSNVTLTTLESARDVIVISGTLSANVSLIFPVTVKQWLVVNNTTGAYAITCKTSSGTGGVVQQGTSRVFYGDGTNLYGVNALASSQAQVDAGTDAFTFLTPKTFKDSTLRAVKASQAEVNAGTDDSKFVTPNTFANASKWGDKADKNGNSANTFSVATASSSSQAVPKSQYETPATESVAGIHRFSTLAELVAGSLNSVGVSPANLLAGFVSDSGGFDLPDFMGGWQVRFGETMHNQTEGNFSIVFNRPFSNDCHYVGALYLNYGSFSTEDLWFQLVDKDENGATLYLQGPTTFPTGDRTAVWFALGK